MEFSDAVKKSIKAFMAGNMPTEVSKLKEGGVYYNPTFFDEYEAQYTGEEVEEKGEDDAV